MSSPWCHIFYVWIIYFMSGSSTCCLDHILAVWIIYLPSGSSTWLLDHLLADRVVSLFYVQLPLLATVPLLPVPSLAAPSTCRVCCSARSTNAPPRSGTSSCLAASARAGATRASSSPAMSTRTTSARWSWRGRRPRSPSTPSSGPCSVCVPAPPSGSASVSAAGASKSTRTSTECTRTACQPARRFCCGRVTQVEVCRWFRRVFVGSDRRYMFVYWSSCDFLSYITIKRAASVNRPCPSWATSSPWQIIK